MTQNTTNPTESLPNGNLLQITVENEARGRGLVYAARWTNTPLSEQQKYVVAELVDRILRTISDRYAENVDRVDEAAKIGFALQARPLLLNTVVLPLTKLRAWKDADHDHSAPQD